MTKKIVAKKSASKNISGTTKKKLDLKRALKNHNRRVARANAAFENLSASEKRVAIARDVLAQIHSKRLTAQRGVYLNLDSSKSTTVTKNTELRDLLKSQKSCTGCALGSMFMCAVEKADKLKVNDLCYLDLAEGQSEELVPNDIEIDQDDTIKYLSKFFPKDQLLDIESAFEGDDFGGDCTDFLPEEMEDSSERMRLIMENIIAHKGKFDPSTSPVAGSYSTPGFVG